MITFPVFILDNRAMTLKPKYSQNHNQKGKGACIFNSYILSVPEYFMTFVPQKEDILYHSFDLLVFFIGRVIHVTVLKSIIDTKYQYVSNYLSLHA